MCLIKDKKFARLALKKKSCQHLLATRLSRGKGDRCLFRVVEGEFEYLWKKARPLTDKTKELP